MSIEYADLVNAHGQALISRRNDVVRLCTKEGSVIRKRYLSEDSYECEMRQLAQLQQKGVPVPRVLYHEPAVAFLEDMGYISFLDVLDMDGGLDNKPVQALLRFMFSFYEAAQGIRGDINLRNFLYRDGICYGVDFEEPIQDGSKEEDMGRMIAYVLTYDPAFDQRRERFARALFSGCVDHGLNPCDLWRQVREEFSAMMARRKDFAPIYERALAYCPNWAGVKKGKKADHE